ncbi:MAG TPA: DUF1461 domain-containing protein [Candidatus Limnocylindrales bacterium]|nr:DUF1461 domain-containing protein [Candidatus Limnocylindrales bacterium]
MAALAAPATPIHAMPWWVRVAAALVSLAAAIVILGATMVPFFSSTWIDFEQGRAGSALLTGYSPDEVHQVTGSIVHDLLLGGAFDVQTPCPRLEGCSGLAPVLDPAEQSHMRDVRGVLDAFAIVVVISLAALMVAAWLARSRSAGEAHTEAVAVVWAAVGRGAAWLAILLVVLGVFAVAAFDLAFELFHRILFPGGNFDFDPRTQKLVQLFPEPFWSETVLTFGAVAIAVSLAVAWYTRRRAAVAAGGRP